MPENLRARLLAEWRRRKRTPIYVLDKQVAASPFRISPERADELQKLLNQYNLKIDFSDDHRGIRVNLSSHDIFVPVADRENIWAQCLRFWVVIQEYRKAQRSGDADFDLHGNRRLRNAAAVVAWSANNLRKLHKDVWPRRLIRPTAKPWGEDRKVANELYLGAMGWTILHEIGHICLNHGGATGPYTQQEEKAADLFATDWVLGRMDPKDPAFTKRVFCIAAGILCLQGFSNTSAPRWKGTHPPAHERLAYCLDAYRNNLSEKVVAFVVVCLQAIFAETTVQPDIDGASFDDILDGLFVAITRQ